MRYWLKYILLLPAFILMRLSTYPLAPIAVLWFSTPDKLRLRKPFEWMMTLDNDLDGDEAWKRKRLIGTDPMSYINRVRWMWRNGAHALNYGLLGCPRPSDYPASRTFTPFLGKFLEVWVGWSSNVPRGKMVLTVRWRDRNY